MALILLGQASGSAAASDVLALSEEADRDDDEALVVTVELGRHTLNPGILIFQDYRTMGEFWLPLGDLMATFQLQVDVSPDRLRAEGWIYNESRRFEMDLEAGVLMLEGERIALSRDQVERHLDDIYVRKDVLEEWLPLHLDVNLRRLQLLVSTIEPLPLEVRLATQERRSRIPGSRQGFDGTLIGPAQRLATLPFMDTNSNFRVRQNNGDRRLSGSYTLRAASGLLGQDFSATLNGSGSSLGGLQEPNLRMTLGRESLTEDLLGIPGLRSYALGDVATPRIPLVANNRAGRGARLSTFNRATRTRGNRITLRGDLPTGWEVEVYRDGTILDFQTAPDRDGRYEFQELRTRSGMNTFKLIFFGPQGQRREEIERFFVDGLSTPAGQTNVELAVNQQSSNLIDLRNRPSGGTASGTVRGVALVEHGLTDRISASASVTTLVSPDTLELSALPSDPLDDFLDQADVFSDQPDRLEDRELISRAGRRQVLLGTGVNATFGGVLANFDAALNPRGGFGTEFSVQSAIDHMRFTLEHREFHGLESEISDRITRLGAPKRESEIDVNASPTVSFLRRPSISMGASRAAHASGLRAYRLNSRLSSSLWRFRQTTQVSWNFEGGADRREETEPRSPQGNLSFRLGTSFGPVGLRGAANYRIEPDPQLRTVNMTADWDLNSRVGVRNGIRHVPENSLTTLTSGLNWNNGRFAIGFNGDVNTDRNFSAQLTLRVGFGINPRNNKLDVRSGGMSSGGAVSPRAFLDKEATGRRDPGDPYLEGVAFRGSGISRDHRTGDDGLLFASGIAPYSERVLELDARSIEDPFLVPTDPKQGFFVRPGQTTYLDFPVVPTGEIDGVVTIVNGERERPGRGTRLQLVRENGEVLKEELVTFDGYYYFGAVPYGRYTLRLARDHDTFIPITLNAENDFAWDTNFVIERE